MYTYCENDPVNNTDPSGHSPKKKYEKPQNPNQRKGAQDRQKSGDRERNVGHPDGEEHSRTAKGKGGRKARPSKPSKIVMSMPTPRPVIIPLPRPIPRKTVRARAPYIQPWARKLGKGALFIGATALAIWFAPWTGGASLQLRFA